MVWLQDNYNKGASSWDQSDFTETSDQDTRSASNYNWGQDVGGDDFFSSVMTNEKVKTYCPYMLNKKLLEYYQGKLVNKN